jgi:PadR family transcriptional regulator, regulatory protein PadR
LEFGLLGKGAGVVVGGYVESRYVSDTEQLRERVTTVAGDVRVTAGVAKVLAAFLEDPAADRYGLDLMKATDMPSGTLYPILARLREAGWVRAEWEQTDPEVSRPARRYYRLTPEGAVAARARVDELSERLGILAARPAGGTAS